MIWPDVIHRADAVGITIERDSQLGAGPANLGLKIGEILRNGGIGMVIGEGSVGFAEERRHFGAERPQGRNRDQAADSVATIHHDMHRTFEPVALDDGLAVGGEDGGVVSLAAPPRPPGLARNDVVERADTVAVQRLSGEHHLEAVELGRIVGAGDLESAVGLQGMNREVERRRGQHSHIDGRRPRLGNAGTDRGSETLA